MNQINKYFFLKFWHQVVLLFKFYACFDVDIFSAFYMLYPILFRNLPHHLHTQVSGLMIDHLRTFNLLALLASTGINRNAISLIWLNKPLLNNLCLTWITRELNNLPCISVGIYWSNWWKKGISEDWVKSIYKEGWRIIYWLKRCIKNNNFEEKNSKNLWSIAQSYLSKAVWNNS